MCVDICGYDFLEENLEINNQLLVESSPGERGGIWEH